MLELGRALPFKTSACVMTPANPRVKADMEHGGVSGKEFLDHLKEMAGLFEIGYHGHYCRPSGTPPSPLAKTEIERSGFALTLDEPEALKSQFLAEYNYLASNLYPPKAYSAGWWFMNSTVAGLLDENGFEPDCSLRRYYRDTFGGKYPRQGNLPGNGVPFRLAGAGKVIELPSVFYLHLNWWTVVRELFPLLWRAGGPLFAVLPTHDYNLKEDLGKVLENIRLLSDIPNVRFVSLSKMKELAESSGPVFGSEGFSAVACPACGPAASRTVWQEKIYRAAECGNCGLIRVDPQPPGLDEIYGETYYRNNYLPKSGERSSPPATPGRNSGWKSPPASPRKRPASTCSPFGTLSPTWTTPPVTCAGFTAWRRRTPCWWWPHRCARAEYSNSPPSFPGSSPPAITCISRSSSSISPGLRSRTCWRRRASRRCGASI